MTHLIWQKERSLLKILPKGSIFTMLVLNVFKLLIRIPWWLSLSISVAGFVYLEQTKTSLYFDFGYFNNDEHVRPLYYSLNGLFCLFGLINLMTKKSDKTFLRKHGNHLAIQTMEWDDFELLVAAAYRKLGFRVKLSSPGADGGVDLYLTKGGTSHIVQCKHYKKQKVGVKVVREMLGVMVGLKAASVSIVCSGGFTKDAYKFSSNNKTIKLITGKELVRLIEQGK
jgi:restriction system protein